jgi:hypothetical protein
MSETFFRLIGTMRLFVTALLAAGSVGQAANRGLVVGSAERQFTIEDYMNEKPLTLGDVSKLTTEANEPLPQIAIPGRKRLEAAIDAGQDAFSDASAFAYAREMKLRFPGYWDSKAQHGMLPHPRTRSYSAQSASPPAGPPRRAQSLRLCCEVGIAERSGRAMLRSRPGPAEEAPSISLNDKCIQRLTI